MLFAALVWGLNAVYHRQVLSKYLLSRTDRALGECRSGIDVLFLGDSHVQHGLNPLRIPRAFNFSSQGEHYILNYYKLRWALSDGGMAPRAIVLPVDLHSFATGTLENHYFRDPWYWMQYVDYIEAARAVGDPSVAGRMVSAVFPFLGSGVDFFRPIDSDELTPIVRGFVQNRSDFSRKPGREAVARERAVRQLSQTALFDPHLVAYFKKILALAADRGVTVVLVRMPVTRSYFDVARRFIPGVDAFYAAVDAMLAPYGNVVVFDYQDRFFGQDDLFWDSDHVNVAGAEYLTLTLWRDCLAHPAVPLLDDDRARAAAAVSRRLAAIEDRRRHAREAGKILDMHRAGRKAAALQMAEAAFREGNHDGDLLVLLLGAVAEKGDASLRGALAEALRTSPIPEKREFDGGWLTALGITGDNWTTDGRPVYLAVSPPEGRPGRHALWLSCNAPAEVLPLTATIDVGIRTVRHTFRAPDRVRIPLPEVPPGAPRLIVVKSDKTWVPEGGMDTRRLGVRIEPAEPDGDAS
mgnify:CR=1 FL=1